MSHLCGGVETGGTWTVCALGRGARALADRTQFPTTTPAETLERIVAWFTDPGRPGRASALGVGSFGPVDLDPASPTYGFVTTTPKAGWQHVSVARELGSRLGVPVAFDTDVNAAAVAESRWGAGRGAPSLCYLTVGTGIGGGIVSGGRPWHGLVHPEVGHLRVPHDLARDPFDGACPVHGDCWEGLAAGPAIAVRVGRDPADVPDAHPVWDLVAEYVAAGILAIVSVVSPHRIVVGGGVMERAGLLDRVRGRLVALNAGYLAAPELARGVDGYLLAPALGDDAGVLGAIALALDMG